MVMKLVTDRDEADYRKLHDDIVANLEFGRGVFLVGFRTDDRTDILPRFTHTLFCDLEQFPVTDCSNDEAVRNNPIVNSIKRYDTACQYFAMFEVDEEIVGGAFISFNRPEEFELALSQALANYRDRHM